MGYADPVREVVGICEQAVGTFEDLGCEVELVDQVMERDPIDMWMSEFYASIGTRLNAVLTEQPEILDPAVADAPRTVRSTRRSASTGRRSSTGIDSERKCEGSWRATICWYPRCCPYRPSMSDSTFPLGMPRSNIVSWVRYTYPFNLTGQPSASVPAGA